MAKVEKVLHIAVGFVFAAPVDALERILRKVGSLALRDASFGQERAWLMTRPRLVRAGSGSEVLLDVRGGLIHGSGYAVDTTPKL